MRLPRSVIVFGVLNIAFGALALCGTVINVVMAFLPIQGDDPITRVVRDSVAARTYLYVGEGVSLLASAWLLASGIGLLLRQSWARTGSVVYGWFAIGQVPVALVLNYWLLMRPLQAEFERSAIPREEQLATLGILAGSSMCSGSMSMLFAALLIYYMTREHVLQAFGVDPLQVENSTSTPPPDTGNPYQSPG